MKHIYYSIKFLFSEKHRNKVFHETERIDLIYKTFNRYYDSIVNEMESKLTECIDTGDKSSLLSTHKTFWEKFYNLHFWAINILYQTPKGVNNQIECINWQSTKDYLYKMNLSTNETMEKLINTFESIWGSVDSENRKY